MRILVTSSFVLAGLAGCAASGSGPNAAPTTASPTTEVWVSEARAVATALPPKLVEVLTAQIQQAGPESAIEMCQQKAPQMAKEASAASGWQVRRVSLRNRNPKAVPDAWERATLEDFDRRAAAGAAPETLERADLVPNARGEMERRYMRALPTKEMCLACHGTADRVSPSVQEKLRTLYPDDRATGYRLGDIRGAMTLRRPS